MRTKDDNFVKALLCLGTKLSGTEIKVLICWMMNKNTYHPTHVQIANELNINDKQVSKAFKKIREKKILENFSICRCRPMYRLTDHAAEYFKEWKLKQEELKQIILGCSIGQQEVVQSDNYTNNTKKTKKDFFSNESSEDFYNKFKTIGESL